MTKAKRAPRAMSKADCTGCEDSFYNGNNPYGVKECWSFKNAKLIYRQQVPIDQRPPWTQAPRIFPSCYRRKGYAYMNADAQAARRGGGE